MATFSAKITNTDGTVPLDKSYTISDELIVHFIEAYASVYTPPANEDGTPGDPYTQPEICEKWVDGLVEGSKNFVASYLREKAQKDALAKLPELVIAS